MRRLFWKDNIARIHMGLINFLLLFWDNMLCGACMEWLACGKLVANDYGCGISLLVLKLW